ncbi:hypothetical protein [Labrys neptuniae]
MDDAEELARVSPLSVVLRSAILFSAVSPLVTGILVAIIFSVLSWYLTSQVPRALWRVNSLLDLVFISYFAGTIPAATAGGIVGKFHGYWKSRAAVYLFAMFSGSACYTLFYLIFNRGGAFAPNVSSAILNLATPALGALVCSAIASRLGWYHRR